MLHNDVHSSSPSRRLLAVAAIAATAAAVAFAVSFHPQASEPVFLPAPMSSTSGAGWSRDESLPDTADTLKHERLADEAPAPTF